MSIFSCDCNVPAFPSLGRGNCVIEMRTMAFPILVPRFKADGSRNTINLASATLGADIAALIAPTTASQERLYPFPRVEEPTFERTETVYDTASSTRKYKVFGVGGVYTVAFQLWGKSAVNAIMRELEKIGCSDVDMYMATVDGNLWGIKDSQTDTIIRGVEVNAETFDSFKSFPTSTTVEKAMIDFDLENTENVNNFYAITADELIDSGGLRSTALVPNIAGYITGAALTNTTCSAVVFESFGSAGNRGDITGLVAGDFTVENLDTPAGDIVVSLVESAVALGTYTITTSAMTATDNYKITCTKTGYEIADGSFVAV